MKKKGEQAALENRREGEGRQERVCRGIYASKSTENKIANTD